MQCQKCGVEMREEEACCDNGVCCRMCCKCDKGEADPECNCDK